MRDFDGKKGVEEVNGYRRRKIRAIGLTGVFTVMKPAGGHGDQLASSGASGFFVAQNGKTIEIRDVWAHNLEEEMEHIRTLVSGKHKYVSMV